MQNHHFVRMIPPGKRHSLASNESMSAGRQKRSVSHPGWLWENASTVTFSFQENVPANLRVRIEFCLRQWEPYISLALELVEDGQGQIRIAVEGEFSESQMGIAALLVDRDKPTMILGVKPEDPEFERVVLHEFGHALGFHHAHLHPDANIPWDKEAVYAYMKKHHWSKQDVDHNYFTHLPRSAIYGAYDKHSVMHYVVPEYWTFGKVKINRNTTLSEGDKNFARKIYPRLNYGQLPILPAPDSLRLNRDQPALPSARHHRSGADD